MRVDQLLRQAFSVVCGQNPEHTWAAGPTLLPFCQRCAGLYVGAFVCVALHLILRPGLGGRFLAAHGLLLLIAAPFGFHWIADGPALRAMTGVLCGFGIGTFLWLAPGTAWGRAEGSGRRAAVWGYAAGLGAVLLVVPLAGGAGGAASGRVLEGLAAAGVVSLAGLALANVAFGLRGVARRVRPWLRSQSKRS
jgi:uncharacterized membrane protein